MEMNINEVSNYLLAEVLKLQADVIVLRETVSVLIQIVKPEAYEAYLKEQKDQRLSFLQRLLVDHPFLKDDFDSLLSQLSSGNQS